ncbi:MAG: hypothetical protein ACMG6H_02225, partial [Acidobacteriota bacterium]
AAAEAQTRFAAARQYESEWRAWLIKALASQKGSNQEQARQSAAAAVTVLSSLEQQWGSSNFQTYLARPDIQKLRAQLHELSGQNNNAATSK